MKFIKNCQNKIFDHWINDLEILDFIPTRKEDDIN